jgi:hypothetical protein
MEPTSPPRGVSAGAWAVVRSPGTARRRRIPLCGTRSNHRPRRPPRGAAAGHASWDQPFITNMPDRGAGRTKDHSITNSPALPKNQLPPAEPHLNGRRPGKGRRDKLGGRPAKETPHRTIRPLGREPAVPLSHCPGQAPPRHGAGPQKITCATPPPGGRRAPSPRRPTQDCQTDSTAGRRQLSRLRGVENTCVLPPRAREEGATARVWGPGVLPTC